jgi:hypothetical protein
MSGVSGSEPANPAGRRLETPAHVRAFWLGVAWLPFVVLMVFVFPQFTPIFAKLEQAGRLPMLTLWFLALARLNAATHHLPMLVSPLLFIVPDLGVASLTSRWKRGAMLYWTWFTVIILLAVLACGLLVASMMLPVYKMSVAI